MNCSSKVCRIATSLVLAGSMLAVGAAQAASGTWMGTLNDQWTNSLNWSASPYPGSADTATFANAGNGRTLIQQLHPNLSFNTINFKTANCAAYTIGGSTLNAQRLNFVNFGTIQVYPEVTSDQTFNNYLQLGADWDAASFRIINDSPSAKLTLAGRLVVYFSGWGRAPQTKEVDFEGVGDIRALGNIQTNGGSPILIYNKGSGLITLSGSNRINQLNLSNLKSSDPSRVTIGGGYLFLDNGTNSWSLMAYSDGVIDGTGTVRLGTGTGENFAKCYVSPSKTLTINAKLISDGGLDLNYGSGTLVLNGMNNLASNIVISAGGTISAAAIGNRGSADSNLGRGQRVRFSGNGGRLLYTGAGETSDRILEINNNARLEHAGTGSLIFSAEPVVGGNVKTLTLQGDTEGVGELAGALGPGAATTSLAKQGSGVWRLSGANSYAGTTAVSGGTLVFMGAAGAAASSSGFTVSGGATLKLENAAGANHADRLNDAAPVTLNGGTLNFSHSGGAADFAETNGALVVVGGTNTVAVSQAAESRTSRLTFASVSRTGGSVDFAGTGLGESDRCRIFITGQADGLIGRWATVNGTSLAAYSGTLGVYAAGEEVFTDIAAQGPDSVIPDDAAAAARINSAGVSGPITLAGGWSNSIGLLLQNTETNATVALRDGATNKTLLTEWVLIARDKADLVLGESAGDGLLMPLDEGGELALENLSSNAVLTVNAVVTNNTAASSLFKTGVGNVTLAGAVRYTGATLLDQGTLTLASDAPDQVLPGAVSGAGALVKTGAGTLTLSGDNLAHTGATLVNEGTVVAQHGNALGPTNGAGTVVASGATLDVGGSLAADTLYMAAGTITVSGSGVDDKGAMTCLSANSQAAALRGTKVSLAADAAFGGNSRWGIWPTSLSPHLDLNGHTFNKVGSNLFNIINVDTDPGAGHIVVQQGTLWLVYDTLLNGSAANTLTVRGGAKLELFRLKYPQAWTLALDDLAQFGVANDTEPYNVWEGPVNLLGTAFLTGSGGRSVRINGQVSGAGSWVNRDALTAYLAHTNNTYTGETIVSNGMLHVAHAGSLPGYATAGKVAVRTGGTLTAMTGDGETGWSKAQIDTLRGTAAFAAAAALGLDTSFGDFVYDTDFSQAGITLAKYGTNTLTLAGVNTLGQVQVRGGTLALSNTSANAFSSLLVTGGGAGTTLNIGGPTEIVNSGNISHASMSGDRCVMNVSGDLTVQGTTSSNGRFDFGLGDNTAGAVMQTSGAAAVSSGRSGTAFLTIGNAGGYGYYRMTGGSLTSGEMALGGAGTSSGGSVSVFDLYGGELTVDGWCLLLAWAKGLGALNIFGGSFGGAGTGGEVIFAYNANSASTAQINLLGPAARMFDRGAATKKLINLARGGTNTLGAVNLNSGELTLYSAYAKYSSGAANTTTPSHFNFNGGLLKAAANNTQLMQGLTAAHVFSGGARIDTAGFDVTINQPLVAPTGYGVSGIALVSGGVGYIGAPAVQITGGSGTGATAIALVDLEAGSPTCGQVTNILVTGAGSGYGAADALTATLRGGGCLTAATLGSVTKSANVGGGLTKLGAGVLTLGGANTYAGATVISNGTLKLANALALPSGSALRLEGGTLDLSGWTVSNAVSGSAGAVINGTLYAEISPAGTNAVGTQTLAFSVESLAGIYLADVTAAGTCDQLVVEGNLDLSNLSLRIVDAGRLSRQKVYHIATVTGELTGDFASTNLTDSRWHVSAGSDGRVRLFFADGLIMQLR